ncbi:hypothetical protein ASL20_09900 [Cupriavidus necator]|uniref:hypothetical protein n=1 Tax=Cupriavidus necator TaxID=106590 RepID=UPI0007357B95|nr:hypothetical protein [Cupriavidus necator]KUE88923.1 hypothetical protein ASL20_09900 [Cupriavidus necator]
MSLPPVTGWVVDALRLTVFTGEPMSLESAGYFEALTGTPPQAFVTRPQAGEYSETGPFQEGQLELKAVLNRLDWLYTATPVLGPTAPSLGQFVEQLEKFVEKFGNWLAASDLKPIRVAVGAAIFYRTEGRTENNALIKDLAPFITFDPSSVSDVAFQFNFQIPSRNSANVVINRLTRLMSMQVRMFNFAAGNTLADVEHTLCRVELDFNTAEASGASVQQLDALPLLREIQDLMVRQVERGAE